jgi:hypothetical protein
VRAAARNLLFDRLKEAHEGWGFETKTSHGATVVVPTHATLLRACDECESTDEAIEELRREMLSSEGVRP